MRVDLHVHSTYSRHSLLKVGDIARIARRRGLHAIALTDHDEVEGALRLSKSFPTIVGEEVSSDSGDITGLFLNSKVERGPALEVMDRIRAQGGLVVIPHPFDSLRKEALTSEELCRKADLIEVFNSRVMRAEDNARARDFAERADLPGVVGSDAHTSLEIGRCWVEVDSIEDPGSFMRAIRAARMHTRKSPFFVHLQTRILKIGGMFH